MKPKIVSAENAQTNTRKSPAELILASVEGNYKTMRQMSERYNVHMETVRRICKAKNADGTKKVNAPKNGVQQGGLFIYLFDEEDVAEMDEYMEKKGYPVEEGS